MIKLLLLIPVAFAALLGGGYYLTQEQNFGAAPVFTVTQGGTGWGNIESGTYLTGNGTGKLSTSTCAQITGSAALCDGNDATGAGGAAAVATSTNEIAGRLSYWTSTSGTPATLGQVATGTLSGTANQIAISATAYTVGAAATLSLPAHVIFPGNFQATNATTTNATTTSFNVTGQVDIDTLTSALIITGAGGILAVYAGA
jgi:hypothetical protein